MNLEKLRLLHDTRVMIVQLTEVQVSYYDGAINKLGIKPSMEHWVFDWMFNSEDKTLQQYLETYKLTIEDLFDE